jgi:hypothetical protein
MNPTFLPSRDLEKALTQEPGEDSAPALHSYCTQIPERALPRVLLQGPGHAEGLETWNRREAS